MTIHPPAGPKAKGLATVPPAVSERIKIARTLCIVFMTFVHVQPGIAENVYHRDTGLFDIIYFILTRIVGLSSVSLLSIVSGYFVLSSLLKAGPQPLAVSKLKTLVVPLVAWNLVIFMLLVAYGLLSGKWQDMPDATLLGVANAFLALTAWPLDVPLWFLRDLFVCCLFAPLLHVSLKRSAMFTFAVLVLFAVFGEDLYILQRPSLILFFALGMWLRVAGISEQAVDRVAGWLTLALVGMVAIFLTIRIERILLREMDETLRLTLDTLLRVTVAAGFWRLTEMIRKSPFAGPFVRFEPYAFFLFCSHAILFNFGGIVFRRFFGNYGSDLFAITFFTLPALAVVAAIVGLQIINRSNLLLFLFNAGHRVRPLFEAERQKVSV